MFPWNLHFANYCLFSSALELWSCRFLCNWQIAVCSRPLRNPAKIDATVDMKRSVDGTIFSREFETGGRSAIDGTPLHIGANPGSPDDQKSSTERLHPTAWLFGSVRDSSLRDTGKDAMNRQETTRLSFTLFMQMRTCKYNRSKAEICRGVQLAGPIKLNFQSSSRCYRIWVLECPLTLFPLKMNCKGQSIAKNSLFEPRAIRITWI